MTHIHLSSGEHVFLGGPDDKFSFAIWEPPKQSEVTSITSRFTMECDNGKSLKFTGKRADEMLDGLLAKAK